MSAIPSPLSFSIVGTAVCPVCRVEHDRPCERFLAAWKKRNANLRVELANWRGPDGRCIVTPIPPQPKCECGKPRRAFAPQCDDCEQKEEARR